MGWRVDGMELPGRIGQYVVERELGAGGMGTVYLARSRGGRSVAVKVARPELAADPHFRARFRAEVEAARRVGGFHTAPVVDADPDAAAPWLATAYIAGPTLSGLLAERGSMGEPEIRLLGAALAEALQAIHACGLIHRDLKPGNIIMADDGPRVLDFGIARAVESTRLTSTGAAFGTPGYLAPEQAQGLEVGSAADVFALGVVLVAAAGGSAFGEGTPMGLMYRSVHEAPDLSALPEGIRATVADCLAKDPAQRPTLERLLDVFSPDTTARPVPASAPAPAPGPGTPPGAGPDAAPYPPTMPTPAASAEPTPAPEPTAPDGAAAGLASAATVSAAARPTTAPPPKKGFARYTVGALGTLLVIGGVGLATYLLQGSGGADDASFPPAKYKLTMSSSTAEGMFMLKGTPVEARNPVPDTEQSKSVIDVFGSYSGTLKSMPFNDMDFSGRYGRFKNPEGTRDYWLGAGSPSTASEDPAAVHKKVRVPGSKIEFNCQQVSTPDKGTVTMCAWGDPNTVGRVEFRGSFGLEETAALTRKVREDLLETLG
jgi:predicted Ser/Thr protein kinase